MEFEKGGRVKRPSGEGASPKRGTVVSFRPDRGIFEETVFHHDTLSKRLRELAFLNRGLRSA